MITKTDQTLLCVPDLRFDGDSIASTTAELINLIPLVTPTDGNIDTRVDTVVATGTPASALLTFTIEPTNTGNLDGTARYNWVDASGDVYGWNDYTVTTGVDSIHNESSQLHHPMTEIAPNGTLLVAQSYESGHSVSVSRRSNTGTWSHTTVWSGGHGYDDTYPPLPSLYRVGSLVYCASFERRQTTGGYNGSLRIDVSSDNGATWALHTRDSLQLASADQMVRSRAVYDPLSMNVYLCVSIYDGVSYETRLYTSADGGSSWTEGDTIDDTRIFDLVVCGDRVLFISATESDLETLIIRSVQPNYRMSQIGSHDTGVAIYGSQLSAFVDESMRIHAVYATNPSASQVRFDLAVSSDSGYSWTDEGVACVTSAPAGDGELSMWTSANLRSRAWLIGEPYGLSAPAGDIRAVLLGGASSVTYEDSGYGGSSADAYLPYCEPDDAGWTLAGTAGSANGEYLQITSATLASSYTYYQSTISVQKQITVRGRVKCVTGSEDYDDAIIRVRQNYDASDHKSVSIRIGSGRVKVRDNSGAGTTLANHNITSGTVYDYLISVSKNGDISAWIKGIEATQWHLLVENQALGLVSGTIATPYDVTIGALSTGRSHDSLWYFVSVNALFFERGQPSVNLPRFDHTTYRPVGFTASSMPQYVTDDISIHWNRAIQSLNDTWSVTVYSTTGLDRCLPTAPTPSPRVRFEAGGTAGSSYDTVFDGGSSYRARLSRNISFLSVINAEGVDSIRLYRNTGSTFSQIAQLSLVETLHSSVTWSRESTSSHTFGVSTSSGYSRLYAENDLRGLWLKFVDSTGATVYGKCRFNEAGQIGPSQTLWIELDPSYISGTLSSLATSASGGSTAATVTHRSGVVLFVQTDESVRYYQVRHTVSPWASTSLGSERIGWLGFGRAYLLSRTERAGAQVDHTGMDSLTSSQSGVIVARRVGPVRRTYTLNYESLIQSTQRYTGGSAVQQVSVDGTTGRAYEDNPHDVLRAIQAHTGRVYPSVLIPGAYVTTDYSTASTVLGDSNVVLGRMQESIQHVSSQSRLGSHRHMGIGSSQLTFTEEV